MRMGVHGCVPVALSLSLSLSLSLPLLASSNPPNTCDPLDDACLMGWVDTTKRLASRGNPKGLDGVFFMHVMKTGGTTLDRVLAYATQRMRVTYLSTESCNALATGIELKNKLWIAIFREPLARVISHYHQVRPTQSYKGGNHYKCRVAAAAGFHKYLQSCLYSSNFQSRYLSPASFRKARTSKFRRVDKKKTSTLVDTAKNSKGPSAADFSNPKNLLDKYFHLVLLTEQLDEGLVVLRMAAGVSVYDILHVRLKSVDRPPLNISQKQLELAVNKNLKDYAVYTAAQQHWNETLSNVKDMARFQQAVSNFRDLNAKYVEFLQTCHPENTDLMKWADLSLGRPKWRSQYVECKNEFCNSHPRCKRDSLLLPEEDR